MKNNNSWAFDCSAVYGNIFLCAVKVRFKWSVLSWLVAVEIMTYSFLLLGCKVDLSIPQWSALWSGNQIIGCNYLFLWLLDLLLLASFTGTALRLFLGCSDGWRPIKGSKYRSIDLDPDRIRTLQGPFLVIFATKLAECNANKTCTLKGVICTVCFCTGLLNPFAAMLAALSVGKRPIKVPNLKPLKLLCSLPMSTWKEFYQNGQYWKHICYRTIKYTVWRPVCVLFSVLKFYRPWQWRG